MFSRKGLHKKNYVLRVLLKALVTGAFFLVSLLFFIRINEIKLSALEEKQLNVLIVVFEKIDLRQTRVIGSYSTIIVSDFMDNRGYHSFRADDIKQRYSNIEFISDDSFLNSVELKNIVQKFDIDCILLGNSAVLCESNETEESTEYRCQTEVELSAFNKDLAAIAVQKSFGLSIGEDKKKTIFHALREAFLKDAFLGSESFKGELRDGQFIQKIKKVLLEKQ